MSLLADWVSNTRDVIVRPSEFFQDVEKGRSAGYLTGYVLISYIVGSILSGVASYFVNLSLRGFLPGGFGGSVASGPMSIVSKAASNFAMGLVVLLVAALLVHLFVYLLGNRGLGRTMEVVVYSSSVYAVLGWIPVVSILGFLYGLYVKARGLENYHEMSLGEALLALVGPLIILAIIYVLILFAFVALMASAFAGLPAGVAGP